VAAFDLVTGGSGFIGSHLVDRLVTSGRRVIVVSASAGDHAGNLARSLPHVELVQGDIRSRDWWPRLARFEIARIFHLAANASVPRSASEPAFDLSTNVLGTVNLLGLARERSARFLQASTAFVYGTPRYVPMDEGHPLLPTSHYGVSKLAAESYVDLYRREYGLDARIVRFFNVFGPHQARYLVFDFLHKATAPGGVFEVLGSGAQVRSQLFVSDAVQAILLVTEGGDAQPYNIGSERGLSVLELARMILEITGRQKRLETTGQSWPGDIPVLVPDISRLKGLGFQPEVSLEAGLHKVWQWWQARGQAASGPS
jgi:UDP-glucose 4-epimerase